MVFTSWDMQGFMNNFSVDGIEPYIWNTSERMVLISELDAFFAFLYGYTKEEVIYIIDSFYTLRDFELRKFGEFLTKRLLLESFSKLFSLFEKNYVVIVNKKYISSNPSIARSI